MKKPNENLKYLVFDMANRVTNYSNLPPRLRKKVLGYCAEVLFYDHGYKGVRGSSSLDSRWGNRLEEAYENGSNTRPLKNKKKGSVSLVDKIEQVEPGLVRKHFRYAQSTVGNQASFPVLSRVMTLKAQAEGKTLPGGRPIKYTSVTLYCWFKSQGGKCWYKKGDC